MASGKADRKSRAAGAKPLRRTRQSAPRKQTESDAADTAARLKPEIDALREQLRETKAEVAALERRAHEDVLTGLLNRRGFAQAFDRTIAYMKRYGGNAALLFLDLDRFKPVNDRHGHGVGDVVLAEIARLIGASVRASDIVARIGGDEIVVVLWNIDLPRAEAKARALEDLVANAALAFADEKLDVGLSAGVTMLLGDDKLEDALQRADQAMYARKRERQR